jgi:hypothetical protein
MFLHLCLVKSLSNLFFFFLAIIMNTIIYEANYPYMTLFDWDLYHTTNVQHNHLPTGFGLQPTTILMARLERFCHFRNDLARQGYSSDSLAIVNHIISFITVDIASRGQYAIQIAGVIVRPVIVRPRL